MANPIGMISIWPLDISLIPTGWALCDGTNGTPDLRGKGIRGAGGALALDDVGGAETHTHITTGDGHTHANDGTIAVAGSGSFEAWAAPNNSAETIESGTADEKSNLDPFHALNWVMRLS